MANPFFSVIMPSYLGKYKNAAANREEKLVRAVKSVLTQDESFELVIVADGCDETIEIIKDNFRGENKIRLFKGEPRDLKKKRNAGGAGIPRNAGLQRARGEYAIYLDADDVYVDQYLKAIRANMSDYDWYWFHDLSWNKHMKRFDKHLCDINTQGQCGTSNICHRVDMDAFWSKSVTYLHDWIFINTLKSISDNYKFLNVVGYGICHVPNLLDV